GNLGHVAEQHGRRSHDLDGDGTKLRDCVGTGIELHYIISAADASVAGGENDVRALQRCHGISRGQPLSGERLRVKVDDNLPFLAAKRSRGRKSGNGEQPHPDKVQSIVIELLFRKRRAGNGELSYGDVGGAELDDAGRGAPWRGNT